MARRRIHPYGMCCGATVGACEKSGKYARSAGCSVVVYRRLLRASPCVACLPALILRCTLVVVWLLCVVVALARFVAPGVTAPSESD